MAYTSHAHRESGWWTVQDDQYPGAISQVRRLDQAAHVRQEAIAFVADVPADTVQVTVRAIGIVLGVSYQRAHQLLTDPHTTAHAS